MKRAVTSKLLGVLSFTKSCREKYWPSNRRLGTTLKGNKMQKAINQLPIIADSWIDLVYYSVYI